jgi:hypothetical protein
MLSARCCNALDANPSKVVARAPRLVIEMGARNSALALGRYNNKITEMKDEYFYYRGMRYMLKSERFYGHGTDQPAASDPSRAMFEVANYSRWIEDKKFIEYAAEFLKREWHFTGKIHSASSVMFELSTGIRRGEIRVLESPIGGRAGSFSGQAVPPVGPAFRPYVMTPKQAFQAAARARSGMAVESMRHGGELGSVVSGAASHAESAVGTMTHEGGRVGALIGGVKALAMLANIGFIRPGATESAFDIGEVTGVGSVSSPLGDALPFELGDMPTFGDSFDIAKTPNRGEPGSWYTNPGSGQMRLYGDSGAPVVDFDFDHDHGQGIPHAHNYGPPGPLGEFNRETGRSFSLLPW